MKRNVFKEAVEVLKWLLERGVEPSEVKQDKKGYFILKKEYLPRKWQ